MESTGTVIKRGLLGLVVASLLVAGCAWAQTQVASDSTARGLVSADVASTTKPASASTPKPHDNDFVIGNGDVLNINVWKQPDLSRAVPVGSDGKVSLPLIGEVVAAGQTPAKLEEQLTSMFKPFLAEPEV